MRRCIWIVGLTAVLFTTLFAQDSVDVTFYYKPGGTPTAVYVPGEFNSWGHNVSGVIPSNDPSLMTKDPTTGIWSKTYRLRVGGPVSGGVPGAYQYKFNENGNIWLPDPLNPLQNTNDNNNSELFIKSPTIYHLIPNSKTGIVSTQFPVISAYIFPSIAGGVDTSTFLLQIDSSSYKIFGSAYDSTTKLLSFVSPAPLQSGIRKLKLIVKNLAGNQVSDSATITVQAGAIQILNEGGYVTLKPGITLAGTIEDTSIHQVKIVQNGTDTSDVTATNGNYSFNAVYKEGANTFLAFARTGSGDTIVSNSFTMTYFVNHSPHAVISFSLNGNSISLSAQNSTDPDTGQTATLQFLWSVDPNNPETISGVQNSTASTIPITKPTAAGEYYFGLVAEDSDGNKDTTRSYFAVQQDGSVAFPTYASNPLWAKMGRVYEMFFNSFTPQQTINAATQKLEYLQKLGVNILWVMPVMKNNQRIDNGPGPGYNIVDFYTVAPEYGTNADFKNFVAQAHQLGMKVILDVTPNHTSYNHPFAQDAKLFKANSFYWNFYQHQLITNSNYHPNLPESRTSDGFVYYDGWDQIWNYNWNDVDARAYMDGVYKWWTQQMGIDGYRFDVYWGPHDRANNGNGSENEMGIPTRTLLKHIKPDIFLLGETAGTGVGTEVNYADDGGGVDAAYDWNLFHNGISSFNFTSLSSLNTSITNYGGDTMGYVPGPNSLFLRFLENHDEERIAYQYQSYVKTMPMATVIFTVPGIPMIYSGQEVGWGLGITDYDQRRRGIIDWNAGGKSLLQPHYQKLAWIRGTFPAFSTQKFIRLSTGNALVYGYTRPFLDQNGIALENFNSSSASVTITLVGTGGSQNVNFTGGVIDGKTYYMNDVYNDTSYAVSFSGGSLTFTTTLPAYGSAVYVLCDSIIHLQLPSLTSVVQQPDQHLPKSFMLAQNYPNPFNPTTVISYQLAVSSHVSLKVYDILGREVVTLVDAKQDAGTHEVIFDGTQFSNGVYFYRLTAGAFTDVKKCMLVK